ncbi:16S rRNA (guanine(527)-N(7))-methyltransferase RsmG [Acetobacter sp. DmW_043]|uniref:16S rRNA (guanine(527)-N(7))-methyltransferase RsmG n=1 Tax=Acetobacter sp. DmW_043 TaxID=1670658 RepID=UPI0035117D9A
MMKSGNSISVSRETEERLKCFVELLLKWNPRINLVSPKDIHQVWERHVQDSLQIVPLLAGAQSFTDLGSGGGFPGIVAAIATGIPATLVESDQRKAVFLREAARLTEAPVTVLAERIEKVDIAPADVVTARALAALPKLLEWTAPLLKKEGRAVFLKGQNAINEIKDAETFWQMTIRCHPGMTGHDGLILEVSNLKRV